MLGTGLFDARTAAGEDDALAAECGHLHRPLDTPADLDPLMDRIGDARLVLIGEASHGTHQYYAWRAQLSKRLISERGFSFAAVEGDWPDCYRVNRHAKAYPDSGSAALEALHAFERWPTWMWANWEVVAFVEWLRHHNEGRPVEGRAGFYGLDVYSLWESMDAILRYLGDRGDAEAVAAARRAWQCFEPYSQDVQEYARATVGLVPDNCQDEAVALLARLRQKTPAAGKDGREALFVAQQNALVVRNAETYYRTMVRGGAASWNVRDYHMADTLDRLLRFHGPDAKAIVWEHNTHVGDARATDMARAGMVNLGELARERHERDGVVLVGCAGHRGAVMAGYEWGAPMEEMEVPPARAGSWEDILHRGVGRDALLMLGDGAVSEAFAEPRGHRAIGVVYDPDYERFGNYVPTVLPARYDALLSFEETQALHPLHIQPRDRSEPPDTYPWSL